MFFSWFELALVWNREDTDSTVAQFVRLKLF